MVLSTRREGRRLLSAFASKMPPNGNPFVAVLASSCLFLSKLQSIEVKNV